MKCIGIPFICGPICKSNINSFAKCSQPLNSTPHKYTEPHKNKLSRKWIRKVFKNINTRLFCFECVKHVFY